MLREGVELYPVLEPRDVRPRLPPGHAHQADLPAEVEHLPVVDTATALRFLYQRKTI